MEKCSLQNKKVLKPSFFLFCFLALALVFSLACSAQSSEASLYLSPSDGTYEVGNTFSVKVKLKSEQVPANVIGAEINFNNNELEAVSISKTGSIFSLWTTEPTFSNSSGRIVFEGGNPTAFQGSSGTIITITFRAKVSATTNIAFSSGSVLAADGEGTNILTSMSGGVYKLKPKIIISEPESEQEYIPPFTLGVPGAPKIFSFTHPDPEEWYSNNDPVFKWTVQEGVTAVRVLYGRNPRSAPTVLYSPPISEKKLEGLEDGIWYFHCQLKNDYGWGGITHFKFGIDTKNPEPFEIEIKGGEKTTNPRPILIFNTIDHLSGIENFEVKIGNSRGDVIADEEIKSNPYQLPVQAPGIHNVIVKASDKAGNYVVSIAEIEILPIETPVITNAPSELSVNDLIVLKGLAIPKAKINIYVEDEKGRVFLDHTQSTDKGIWYFTFSHSVPEGNYKAWAEAIDKEGARSMSSEAVYFSVKKPIFVKVGALELDYQKTFIIFIGLIMVLGLWFILLRLALERRRRKIKKEAEDIGRSLREAFESLRTVSDEYLEKIDKIKSKRELTRKEKQIKKSLKENLKVAEKFIEKEIKDLLHIIKK